MNKIKTRWSLEELEKWLKPICFICKKEVEEFYLKKNTMEDSLMGFAKCHGQEEFKQLLYASALDKEVKRGYAFMTLALPNRPKMLTSSIDPNDGK